MAVPSQLLTGLEELCHTTFQCGPLCAGSTALMWFRWLTTQHGPRKVLDFWTLVFTAPVKKDVATTVCD